MDTPLSDQIQALTQQLQQWYEQSPRAQRAYERLSADVEQVLTQVQSLVNDTEALRSLRDRLTAFVDPNARDTTSPETTASTPGATPPSPAPAPSSPHSPDEAPDT
jgi:hypothetical protein